MNPVWMNPDTEKIRFVHTETKPDLFGFANPNPKCFQKIRLVDSVRTANFLRFDESTESDASSRIFSTYIDII